MYYLLLLVQVLLVIFEAFLSLRVNIMIRVRPKVRPVPCFCDLIGIFEGVDQDDYSRPSSPVFFTGNISPLKE